MKIERTKTTGVAPDGLVEGGGAVVTTGGIHISAKGGGCGAGSCKCSPGHWLSIILPRTEAGEVESIKLQFASQAELDFILNALRQRKEIRFP